MPKPRASLTHDGYPARKNADGTVSTEVSVTVTDPRLNGGRPTNIPSLWGGKEVDEDTAVSNALKAGRKYDSFDTVDDAVSAARARSAAGGANAPVKKAKGGSVRGCGCARKGFTKGRFI
jgi:hypothetical protein